MLIHQIPAPSQDITRHGYRSQALSLHPHIPLRSMLSTSQLSSTRSSPSHIPPPASSSASHSFMQSFVPSNILNMILLQIPNSQIFELYFVNINIKLLLSSLSAQQRTAKASSRSAHRFSLPLQPQRSFQSVCATQPQTSPHLFPEHTLRFCGICSASPRTVFV